MGGGIVMVLVQVALIGSFWNLADAWTLPFGGDAGVEGWDHQTKGLVRGRLFAVLHFLVNSALLASCLVGSGRADALLLYGPWMGSEVWPAGIARGALSVWAPLSFL